MRAPHPDDVAAAVFGEGGDLILRAVATCPMRGTVLPHTSQPGCGCDELTECRAGRGRDPAGATLYECLLCVLGRRGVGAGR